MIVFNKDKLPFIWFLLPALVAIFFCSLISPIHYFWIVGLIGILLICISFFVKRQFEFELRWIFGAGSFLFIFFLFCLSFQYRENNSTCTFSNNEDLYLGYVIDIPEQKSKTIACNFRLIYPEEKKVVLYLEKDSSAYSLSPGTEFLFKAKMQPLKNFGNPDDFDYVSYMKNQGFSASVYVPFNKWIATGKTVNTIVTLSQRFRIKILDFYKSFELPLDGFAFISALTIGYKADLTEKVQNAFRISGTAHVLAVSGLHVGIVYFVFSFLLSFLGKSGPTNVIKQLIIIVLLWIYAFITGMSPAVVRAAIMLSLVCAGKAIGRKGFSYNTIALSAFAILLINPLTFFDVGFQMSFVSVLAILFFVPQFYKIYNPSNRWVKTGWDMLLISISAQLGVFPIVLYYFGTFPNYFIFTNLLIVPLTTIITYFCIATPFIALLTHIPLNVFEWLYDLTIRILKALTDFTLNSVYFFESLPYAQLSDIRINILQLLILFTLIIGLSFWFIKGREKHLVGSLTILLILLVTHTYTLFNKPPDSMVVFNSPNRTEIKILSNGKNAPIRVEGNNFLPHPSKKILRLCENKSKDYTIDVPLNVDVLILSQDGSFSLKELSPLVRAKIIVTDSSLPAYTAKRLMDESAIMGLKLHNVTEMGAYYINL
ncbi:MAG: ComEC/Rec2 family competence protein [Dysgonamonadaceae bacterium]|jgi:competence protein ComEC|nr:ComEC/Rec2 family competence protein [Dysgonamonadaceae bacterium]MDD3308397.1 ComEC/Rec2 family competence protein [Dysgonamonadaceae bacterium]MDD3900181.1 ComEC/Rec2 family competence protein [Dysgonamonadaceae bacterium]MDD4398889.1 ComEC/Rec2 family competence protein [Dysgonamonadaceae bacterium]